MMHSCKICGAQREALAARCKYCGMDYMAAKITGENYIEGIRKLLQNVDAEVAAAESRKSSMERLLSDPRKFIGSRKRDVIATFAMPDDLENLMQFFALCHGSAQTRPRDPFEDEIWEAWYGKAQMAFAQLKVKGVSAPELVPFIAEYEPLYGVGAKKPMSFQGKFLAGLMLFFLLFFSILGLAVWSKQRGENSERQRIEAAIATVQSLVAAGSLDAAEAASAQVNWTLRPRENDDLVQSYNQRRAELGKLIGEARQSAGRK